MRPRLAALTAGAALALGGCSFSFYSGTSVPAADIEQEITSFFLDSSGREVSIDCPEDLEGEEGHSVQCSMVEGAAERTVEVTVDSVEDSTVSYSFTVLPDSSDAAITTGPPGSDEAQVTGSGEGEGTEHTEGPGDDAAQTGASGPAADETGPGDLDEPVTLPADGIEETIAAEVSEQTGQEARVTCPEDLPGVPGASMACELGGAAGPGTVEVVVDSVTDTDVHYSFEVVG